MHTNLFERKEFLDQNWIPKNSSTMFANSVIDHKTVIQINLLRATANEAETFKEYLKNLSSKIENTLIFDLSECNFVDSTFLSSILTFNRNNKTKVELVVKDMRQLTIFKITKLDKIFDIYPSMELAMAS
jgi:anti-sigma B factor antagonist